MQQLTIVPYIPGKARRKACLFPYSVDRAGARGYNTTMKYSYFTWWLSFSIKPLWYRIWKTIATTVLFVLWVVFVAVYPEKYWQFCGVVIAPVAVVDIAMDVFLYVRYRRLTGSAAESSETASEQSDIANESKTQN